MASGITTDQYETFATQIQEEEAAKKAAAKAGTLANKPETDEEKRQKAILLAQIRDRCRMNKGTKPKHEVTEASSLELVKEVNDDLKRQASMNTTAQMLFDFYTEALGLAGYASQSDWVRQFVEWDFEGADKVVRSQKDVFLPVFQDIALEYNMEMGPFTKLFLLTVSVLRTTHVENQKPEIQAMKQAQRKQAVKEHPLAQPDPMVAASTPKTPRGRPPKKPAVPFPEIPQEQPK